jgi:putative chitinase
MPDISFVSLLNVARYYEGLPHQQKALEYLQRQVAPGVLKEFAELWRSRPQMLLTLDGLFAITRVVSKVEIEPFLQPLNEGFERFQVNTPLRVCHFLAQVLHESGEFRWMEELADGGAYEGRADLGNVQAGDGYRFKGRGLIQVTGRANYSQISKDLNIDYLNSPQRLAKIPDCVNSAFWFWNSRNLSRWADVDDFDRITRIVNGGYNGYEDRKKYLTRAKEVFGL